MPRAFVYAIAALFYSWIFLAACDNPDLEKVRGQLADVQTQNDVLRRQYSDLQQRFVDLEAEHKNLIVEYDDLKQWSREVLAAIGPSVWSPGTYERPRPVMFFKHASLSQLVKALNRHLQSIQMPQIELLGIQEHTAVVQVEEETQLTQNMGTTGAQGYLGAVTYTLCSLEEIECVDFKFEPGTHAIPGRYCR